MPQRNLATQAPLLIWVNPNVKYVIAQVDGSC
jgi:hypothetical protein